MAHNLVHHFLIAFRAIVQGVVLLLIWTVVSLIGVFFWTQFSSPINLLIGGPLFLIGVTMGLSSFYEMIVGIISWRWGRTHCPFCKTSEEPKKILSPHDAFEE